MTTFVSKTANFAGGRLVDYDCPIADASVCVWLGGSLDDAVRNFGTGADLEVAGAPQVIDELWCRVNGAAFFQTDALRANENTLVAVYRLVGANAQSGANRPTIIGNEAPDGTGRSGFTLYADGNDAANEKIIAAAVQHTNENGTLVSTIPSVVVGTRGRNTPQFGLVSEARLASGLSRVRAELLTAPTAAAQTDQNATTAIPPVNLGQPAYRIGASNRTDSSALIGQVDIAFAAIIPRLLTDVEKALVYASVKRRFSAFGITI